MTDMPELKPCPFCGGEAELIMHKKGKPYAWENDCDHWVSCMAEDCCARMGFCGTREEAVELWNRRAALVQP